MKLSCYKDASKLLVFITLLSLNTVSTGLNHNEDDPSERRTVFKRLQSNYNQQVQRAAKAAAVSLDISGLTPPNFRLERIIRVAEEDASGGTLYEMLLIFSAKTDTYERTTVCMARITDGFDGKRNFTRLHTPPSACLTPLEIHFDHKKSD